MTDRHRQFDRHTCDYTIHQYGLRTPADRRDTQTQTDRHWHTDADDTVYVYTGRQKDRQTDI